jgi:hypothetical protein
MRSERRGRVLGPPALALAVPALLLATAPPAHGQRADFLFRRPHATVAVLGGWAMPGENSELFEFTREQLTVSRGDFASPLIFVEGAVRLTEWLDLALGLEYTNGSVGSEDRLYVYQDDSPILQTTDFKRRRLMGSVKGYLLPRGRQISEFAWIPSRWSPYLGVGLGMSWYEFLQEGDFVDYQTLDIFEERFRAKGRGMTGHVLAGVDVSLTPRFLVRGEYRYIRGEGKLDDYQFEGFDDVDLSGSRVALGLAVRL